MTGTLLDVYQKTVDAAGKAVRARITGPAARRHVHALRMRHDAVMIGAGTANGVFRWRRSVIDALFALLEREHGDPLRQVLARFCRDYEGSMYGYPDLLVLDLMLPGIDGLSVLRNIRLEDKYIPILISPIAWA